jgi:hypothetical protein
MGDTFPSRPARLSGSDIRNIYADYSTPIGCAARVLLWCSLVRVLSRRLTLCHPRPYPASKLSRRDRQWHYETDAVADDADGFLSAFRVAFRPGEAMAARADHR